MIKIKENTYNRETNPDIIYDFITVFIIVFLVLFSSFYPALAATASVEDNRIIDTPEKETHAILNPNKDFTEKSVFACEPFNISAHEVDKIYNMIKKREKNTKDKIVSEIRIVRKAVPSESIKK